MLLGKETKFLKKDLLQNRRGNVVQREGFEEIKNTLAIAAQKEYCANDGGKKIAAAAGKKNEP